MGVEPHTKKLVDCCLKISAWPNSFMRRFVRRNGFRLTENNEPIMLQNGDEMNSPGLCGDPHTGQSKAWWGRPYHPSLPKEVGSGRPGGSRRGVHHPSHENDGSTNANLAGKKKHP